uniref:portal protein n=1 Tax=Aliarcobacter sp. TaxID=2321116 RepID=UPI0040480DCD
MFTDTTQLKYWFNESINLLDKSRKLARQTLEYKEGEQLADDIKVILTSRGQPEQWENNIQKYDTKIVGFQDTRQVQVGITGRQKEDKLSARILKDVIRAIQDETDFEVQKELSDEDMRIAGFAVQEIKVIDSGKKDIFGRTLKNTKIINIPSSESFLDPHSKKEDYSDARHFTQAFFTDIDELYALGFKKEDIEKLHTNNYLDKSLDEDLYQTGSFTKRILLCYTWYKQWSKKENRYKYYYCYWCDNVILKQEESPFQNFFDGFPIIVQFLRKKANRTKNIKGHAGIYKDLIPLQDAINHAKLRLHNMLGNVKVLVESDAVDDVEIFKNDYNLDNAIVEVERISGVKDIRQHTEYQQIINIIVDARNQMKEILGFNDELLAVANNRLSGEAISKRLATGTFGLAEYFKSSSRLQKRTIEAMISFIVHYYDATRVVKIIEADDNIKYFTINEPEKDENGFLTYEPTNDGFVKPKMKNTIEVGEYDLIFSEEAKEVTSANERFRLNIEMLKQIQQINPALAQEFMPEVYEDANAPIAEKLRGLITQMSQNQSNQPSQEEQLKAAKLMSDISLNEAKTSYNANKNAIEMMKIQNAQAMNQSSNETKQGKILIDSLKGIR